MTDPTTAEALAPTWFIDADHPDVRAFARQATADTATAGQAAAALFTTVRDHLWYDPYAFDLQPAAMRASAVLTSGRNWCVPKSTLLAATCRAVGIPARLGFADVRNHLSSEKLHTLMGTDVFAWHGYTEIQVEGRWHKATPAFNRELCDRFGVEPLTFDGTAHALLHAHDGAGRRHMEYLVDHGTFDDLPLDQLIAALHAAYPAMTATPVGVDDDPAFHAQD